jgi:hypothetical protein
VTYEDNRALLAEMNPNALLADGFEEALIGYATIATKPPVVLYDYTKCITVLMTKGLSHEEAEEYMSFNVTDAWLGEGTPAFAFLFTPPDE